MTRLIVHGTAIRLGETGIILVGPSGAGKSSMALALMATARRMGLTSQLIGDDRVEIVARNNRVHALALPQMTGRIELRGTGIGTVPHGLQSELHVALEPVDVTAANRIPEEDRHYTPGTGIALPLLSIDRRSIDPFAVLEAMIPGFPGRPPA